MPLAARRSPLHPMPLAATTRRPTRLPRPPLRRPHYPTPCTSNARSGRSPGSRTGLRVRTVRRMHELDRCPADPASWRHP